MTMADDIPVAHTPAGGYGASFPPLVLAGCTEPLVAGAPDLRGVWKTVSATRGGEPVPADDRLMAYTERIEQCGNRIVDCGGGTIADARADGTEENGVHDVSAFDYGLIAPTRFEPIISGVDGIPSSYERCSIRFPTVAEWHVWVLADHYEAELPTNVRMRTYLGQLLYDAKYSGDRRSMGTLEDVIRLSVLQLRQFQKRIDGLSSVNCVAAVPCNPPKRLSVPHELAGAVAEALAVPDLSSHVIKVKETSPAKMNPGLHPEVYAVRGTWNGRAVLLVDDIFRTGSTLESVASRLRQAGASSVVGLCMTKAHKGMNS